jgi:hypothetical protein
VGCWLRRRQARLDELLARNGEGSLPGNEQQEMDQLIHLADQLTLLKARAQCTLGHLKVETAGS